RLKVLERKSDRLEDLMARVAGGIRMMRFHRLPHRRRLRVPCRIRRFFLDCGNARWRIRRTDAEKRLQEPLSPRYRRGPGSIRGHDQQRALAQEPATHVEFGTQRHAAELWTV